MWKKLSHHDTISMLHVGSAMLLAAVLVISSFAASTRTPADGSRNSPPNTPSNPFPVNGSTNVSINAQLNWSGGDPDNDTVTYDVYFGTNQTPLQVGFNISATTFDPGTMNHTTTYYWMVVAWDNTSLSTAGPLWMFTTGANQPPYTPNTPNPGDNATNVPITKHLGWAGGDPDNDTVTYDVYFGTTNPPPLVVHNQSGETYDPGTMNYLTIYYWMIIAWDTYNQSAAGPLWMFTTGANQPPYTPNTPYPGNNATNVAITKHLGWAGGDPDNDTITYDVYFGTTNPPPLVVHNQSGETYDPGTMNYLTIYHWMIIAWDTYNQSAAGPIWKFTTTAAPPSNVTVTITKPSNNSLYVNDVFSRSLNGRTIVYGKITITANASSGAGIKNVSFYIDGKLVNTTTSPTNPHTYLWNPVIQFKGLSLRHTIKVVAFDNNAKSASAQINVTKWRLHILVALIAGAALVSVLIPHTTMKGLVLNLRQTGVRGYTFFALRMHFHTVSLLKNVKGVVKWKRCVVRFAIPPTVIVKLGPPRTLTYLSITFLGANIDAVTHQTGGILQNLPPVQQRGKTTQGAFSSFMNSMTETT